MDKKLVILFIDEINLSLTFLMDEVKTSADELLLLDEEVDTTCKRCRNFELAKFDRPSLPMDEDEDRLGCIRVYLRSRYSIYSSNSCSSSTVGGGEGVVVVDGGREDI